MYPSIGMESDYRGEVLEYRKLKLYSTLNILIVLTHPSRKRMVFFILSERIEKSIYKHSHTMNI